MPSTANRTEPSHTYRAGRAQQAGRVARTWRAGCPRQVKHCASPRNAAVRNLVQLAKRHGVQHFSLVHLVLTTPTLIAGEPYDDGLFHGATNVRERLVRADVAGETAYTTR